MKLSEFSFKILKGQNISDKLCSDEITDFDEHIYPRSFFSKPKRNPQIAFSDKKIKFPKGERLFSKEGLAIAMNSFAHHELMAIEIMAMALLLFPHDTQEMLRFKKGILKTLKDEQKHFKLYVKELNHLGYQFGDFPLNDFLWRQSEKITTPSEYVSVMAITFEGANLDFAHYFSYLYRERKMERIANILQVVYEDEISHVALGGKYLNLWKGDQDLWTYYLENLPFPITAARAKGLKFYRESRKLAGLSEQFVDELEKYQDEFKITHRKTWKK